MEVASLINLETYFPGADYNNVRFKDFDLGRVFEVPRIDKNSTARMPWRDIHLRVEGDVLKDLSRSFLQYWGHIKTDISKQIEEAALGISKLKESIKVAKKNSEENTIRGGESIMPIRDRTKIFEDYIDTERFTNPAPGASSIMNGRPSKIQELLSKNNKSAKEFKSDFAQPPQPLFPPPKRGPSTTKRDIADIPNSDTVLTKSYLFPQSPTSSARQFAHSLHVGFRGELENLVNEAKNEILAAEAEKEDEK